MSILLLLLMLSGAAHAHDEGTIFHGPQCAGTSPPVLLENVHYMTQSACEADHERLHLGIPSNSFIWHSVWEERQACISDNKGYAKRKACMDKLWSEAKASY